jgi:large subunit ribosomal protein L29
MEDFKKKKRAQEAELSVQELQSSLREAEQSLLELRIKKCSSQLEKSHIVSNTKKQIARIKTFLRQKTCKACKK